MIVLVIPMVMTMIVVRVIAVVIMTSMIAVRIVMVAARFDAPTKRKRTDRQTRKRNPQCVTQAIHQKLQSGCHG